MDTSQAIPNLHAVILAGGSGARFWPLSRELSPKQMLDIFGGVSLISRAVHRIAPLLEPGNLHVLTNERLLDELRNHLAAQEDIDTGTIDFLAEPTARNTAPAIALAAAYLLQQDPEAMMIVLPSDHLLEDGPVWESAVRLSCDAAEGGALVTIGLTPTHAETGYGYIRAGRPMPGLAEGELRVCGADRFVEKPDAETARRYLEGGDYLWNSGMLVACAASVLSQLRSVGRRKATPDSSHGEIIARVAEELAAMTPAEWLARDARDRYTSLPSVPFDKAVLEVSERVAVLPVSLSWSDVGSLLSLEKLAEADDRGNVLVGNILDVDSHGVIGYSADRLVATLGLDDLIIVDTTDATLVAAKDRTQDVRLVVEALRAAGAPEVVSSRSSLRPWGSWTLLMKADRFQIKSIEVLPGKRLSLQSHEKRSEHWVVVDGEAVVERDGETATLAANESAFIPPGTRHRLGNAGDTTLQVIEVAVGDYLEEDDIVRFEDDWGREGGTE
ncbi:MAG: mannose-1-phosphate guanylyltransferase/mannose-6-phosphate isomerase [Coriobacteriia bacterium]|nr:mannose-1-phosphate guanylyltransferase/mannose-6-phosphate isomerase [Coriobacteriia bacterium]